MAGTEPLSSSSTVSAQRYRVCTYNIFEGLDGRSAHKHLEKVELFKSWLSSQCVDIVGLNEANDFTQAYLQELGAKCGYEHCYLFEANTNFHLGIMSKYPFRVFDTSLLSQQLHHGLLHVLVDLGKRSLHVLITHLTPFEAKKRRTEVQAILDYADPWLKEDLLLMGDLNSLSKADDCAHKHEQLRSYEILKHAKKRRKFLDEDGQIDYEPIAMLHQAGFVDHGCTLGDSIEALHSSTTVPTPVNRDTAHAGKMRLDFILASPGLSTWAQDVHVSTVKDQMTEGISDHFPVILAMSVPDALGIEICKTNQSND